MEKVQVIMGSISDWETMKEAVNVLSSFNIAYDVHIISAHRTPQRMIDYAKSLLENEVEVVIAGAGGAAHLPGMVAANTIVPVIGVPVMSKALHGVDSLLSIVQMPSGIPVATTAIGTSGAKNAGYLAAQILAINDQSIKNKLLTYRQGLAEKVVESERELNEK
ncbi:5-(carboxyamino)imidazole ribonucleotide mutase [Fructilactobacillus sp. Tb1]|uniref:5-(carboxyamino)imidazole ribonucleotide mutase n=1 Tax=Fructilactobacillus sp. Tb1 TaxID=3422304 RepID=UPI003D26998E